MTAVKRQTKKGEKAHEKEQGRNTHRLEWEPQVKQICPFLIDDGC